MCRGGISHVNGVKFIVAIGKYGLGAIEGDVFDDIFFGGIGHGAFHLKFWHRPKKQLVYRVGIGGITVRFVAHQPFAIHFFQGEVRHFGVVGADGDFVDLLGVFKCEQVVRDGGGLVEVPPQGEEEDDGR